MKIKQLMALADERGRVGLGLGATRAAFYVRGNSRDVLKYCHNMYITAGCPKLSKKDFVKLTKALLKDEEKKVVLNFFKRKKSLRSRGEEGIIIERLISEALVSTKSVYRHNFIRCVEVDETVYGIVGRYHNLKHKPRYFAMPTRSNLLKLLIDGENYTFAIGDLHMGNMRDFVISDYACVSKC